MTDHTPRTDPRRAAAHARTARDVAAEILKWHSATCERLAEYVAQMRAAGATDAEMARIAQWFIRTLATRGLPIPSIAAPGQGPRLAAEDLITRITTDG